MKLPSVISFPLWILGELLWGIVRFAGRAHIQGISRRLKLPASAKLGEVTVIGKNLSVGEHTYFNSGYVSTSSEAHVRIGSWCAIGYNVTVLAVTHESDCPTGPASMRPLLTGNVEIGDGTWIGNNVVIIPGVTIGRQCVIGANAVVTGTVPDFAVAAGIPCRVVRIRKPEELNEHSKIIERI